MLKKKMLALQKEQTELKDDMSAILAADGVMSDEDQASYEEMETKWESLDTQISRVTNQLEREKTQAAIDLRPDTPTVEEAAMENIGDARPRILNDPMRGYRDMGDFAMSVYNIANPNIQSYDNRLDILSAATGMNQTQGSDGGFLVPPSFSSKIWDGLNTDPNNLLSMTDNFTVEGESLEFPANAETSRATGSRYGGVQGYWIAEAEQITNSKPTFRKIKVEPHEMAVLVYSTDKLLRNTTALNQWITRAATSEINFLTGDAIINGDGVGKPKGILTSGSLVTVAKETSQAADTIQQANISKMWSRLHANARAGAVWFINQDVEPQLDGLNLPIKNVAGTENVGGITNVVYNAQNNTIKGRPIIPIEYCATLGDKGDIILANLSTGYLSGTQGGIDSAMSIHLRFDFNETAFRFLFQVDGQPWLQSALTPFKGSSTLSTHVTLAARA